jgi:hypothetical protein
MLSVQTPKVIYEKTKAQRTTDQVQKKKNGWSTTERKKTEQGDWREATQKANQTSWRPDRSEQHDT